MRVETTDIRTALASVKERIARACERAGRDPAQVRLVAVSKAVPASRVGELLDAGHDLLGENRVQEALPKQEEVGRGAVWHFIGHLQRNKARLAVGRFELIHSVDNQRLALELDRRAGDAGVVQPILLQLNLSHESTKSGVNEAELPALLRAVTQLRQLDLRGMMIIPPPVDRPEDNRDWFRRMRELRDRASGWVGRALPELSMGMTDDFEVAVEEGATLVRVGRAIFGERPD